MDAMAPASTSSALLPPPLPRSVDEWQVVLRSSSSKLVLLNKHDNSLAVSDSHDWDHHGNTRPRLSPVDDDDDLEVITGSQDEPDGDPAQRTRQRRRGGKSKATVCPLCLRPMSVARPDTTMRQTTGYFALLSEANSAANTPRNTQTNQSDDLPAGTASSDAGIPESAFNTGYFSRFFSEIRSLGKGGNGTVVLVRHVLNGESLGLYACKKVAIGSSATRLPQLLREVHLLEALQHRNLITYHHSWVENCRFSSFGPTVPALHILMAFANGGNLSTFISQRRGTASSTDEATTKEERLRRYRLRNLGAVHLLRLDEILALFEDCVEGLGYLHSKHILHLDLKAENVLLSWEEDALALRQNLRSRLFQLGPRSLPANASGRKWNTRLDTTGKLGARPKDSAPSNAGTSYRSMVAGSEDADQLESEIRSYPGFFAADAHALDHGHHIPSSLLRIISRLVHRTPSRRPSCEEVLVMLERVREESLEISEVTSMAASALVTKQRSPSPSGTIIPLPDVDAEDQAELFTETDAFLPAPPLEEDTGLKIPPPLLPTTLRTSRLISSILVAMLILVKIIATERFCRDSLLSHRGLYALLLPLLLETLVFRDLRVSLFVFSLHLLGMAWAGSEGMCAPSAAGRRLVFGGDGL